MKKCFYLSGLLFICFSLFTGTANAQAVITTDPANVTACAGSTTMFNIAATGATSYMWQVSTDGTTWDTVHASSFYSTVTDDTLTVHPDATLNGNMYRAIAFATGGNDTSAAATLNVDIASAGTITGPDAICSGTHMAFTSSVAGGVWSNVNHTVDVISVSGIDTGHAAGTDTIKYAVTNTCGTTVSWKLVHVDIFASALAITGPDAVCVGNNIDLMNLNTDGTGVWSSSNVAIGTVGAGTGIVHGVGAGLDTITYTFTNACNTVISLATVNVETTISAGTITGASSVCNGSWTTLSDLTPGGTWLSGTGSVAVVDGSGNVTGVSEGSSVISYLFSNSCGVSVATHTVNVVVAAGPIIGADSVGIDSVIVLSDIATGGVWSMTLADTSIATLSSTGHVTGVDTGVMVVTYTVSNACGTSSVTKTINVGPLPFTGAIKGPDTVCLGAAITLVDTTSYGAVSNWRSKWDTVATISPAGVVTGLHRGIDTIYATVTSAFGSQQIKRYVYVNSSPLDSVSVPSGMVLGGAYPLYANYPGTWSSSNDAVLHIFGAGYVFVASTGTAIITFTAINTCGTTVSSDTVTIATVGVNNINKDESSLSVFPNPSNGSVTLSLAAGIHEAAVVTVTNLLGEKVKEFTIKSNTATNVSLDQPAGIYLLTAVTADGKQYSAKINIAK